MIRAVWQSVAEDYAPFNVNVTTVEPAALAEGVPESEANGNALRVSFGDFPVGIQPGFGFSYVNSFTNETANVAYVWMGNDVLSTADLYANNPDWFIKWTADTATHEAGHAFGLQHQSLYDADGTRHEYHPGWEDKVPIMGASGMDSRRSVWYDGTSTSADTYQDDMAVLAQALGWRPDDHGNTVGTATPLSSRRSLPALPRDPYQGVRADEISFDNVQGIIGTTSDADYFQFHVSAPGMAYFTATPDIFYPNLDLKLEIRDARGRRVALADPEDTLWATIDANLAAGDYVLVVRSHGDYGDVGQYWAGGGIRTMRIPPGGRPPEWGSPVLWPQNGVNWRSPGVSSS